MDKIKWEELIPEDANAEDVKKIIAELNKSAKYFSRLSVSEKRYGKNFDWAKKVNSIAQKATEQILQKSSIHDVLATIADGYKNIDTRNINGFDEVGILRKDFNPDEPHVKSDIVVTPFSKEKNIYAEYADRLSELNLLSENGKPELHKQRKKQCKYSAYIVDNTIVSGSIHDIKRFQFDIEMNYKELKPLFEKVKNGQTLTGKDIKIVHDNIAELYYRIANFCPYERGTNGIADIFIRSIYDALNIDMPALKKGVSLDLESFCVDMKNYKRNWNTFFENDCNGIYPNDYIIKYEETIKKLEEKLQNKSNISDLIPLLKIIQENAPGDFNSEEVGRIKFYETDSDTTYNLEYDGNGNIIRYETFSNFSDSEFYIYDKSDKLIKVNSENFFKPHGKTRPNDKSDYIIKNPDLFPQKTRELLLQEKNHYYTKEDIDELSSMLKTSEDIEIVNKLLDTRGPESKILRFIGNTLNVSQQKFGVRDIIKILKSEKARKQVLISIKNGNYVKRTELELLLDGKSFDIFKQKKFEDEIDLSYRTKELKIEGATNIINLYKSDTKIKAFINSQVPDGEATCINGKMYCRAGEELIPIKLTKDTFDKLFPVKERYNISQGALGDCYFIAELGGYMSSPNGRAAIFSCFREEGDDIFIKFPHKKNIEIKFNNGKLNNLSPLSAYTQNGKLKIGTGDAHVEACDGIKMIEQAYSFVRNNNSKDEIQIIANDMLLMNKQLQELTESRAGTAGAGEVPNVFQNAKSIVYYRTGGFSLNGVYSVEEGLEIFAKELKTNPNIYGSVCFHKHTSLDINLGLHEGHQYRIVDYDTETQIVKLVDPHDSSKYIELPLEVFKEAQPNYSIFKIFPPILEI